MAVVEYALLKLMRDTLHCGFLVTGKVRWAPGQLTPGNSFLRHNLVRRYTYALDMVRVAFEDGGPTAGKMERSNAYFDILYARSNFRVFGLTGAPCGR